MIVLGVHRGHDSSAAIFQGGEVIAVAFKHNGEGYGGNVSVMVGIDMESKVTGIKVLEHNETPGLGAKVAEPVFTDQFKGKHFGPDDEIEIMEGEPAEETWQVEGLSGATISTYAVVGIVNEAIEMFDEYKDQILEAAEGGAQ